METAAEYVQVVAMAAKAVVVLVLVLDHSVEDRLDLEVMDPLSLAELSPLEAVVDPFEEGNLSVPFLGLSVQRVREVLSTFTKLDDDATSNQLP